MKSVRFTQVVARCGKPETHTLWMAPEADRELQAALKEHRVMTVHQETTGQKKDYGEVGYTHDPQGNLLIFPKSLQAYEGQRVIGVKYELLEAPPAAAPAVRRPKKESAKPKPEPATKAENLRIFRPEEEKAPVEAKKPPQAATPPKVADLLTAIRRALKQLHDGKAVAACQTLEKVAGAKKRS